MKENTMGKKIRALRLQKGMTQAALAGETVTRNMLSQIENGSAQPSVATIQAIAEKLDVPTEFFFSECEDIDVFRKIGAIDKIRRAFADGDYGRCIYRLEHLGVSDEETEYLWAEAYFALGVSHYREGKLRTAQEELAKSFGHAQKTHYVSEGLLCAIRRYETAIRFIRDKESVSVQDIPQDLRGCMADIDYVKALSGVSSGGGDGKSGLYERHLAIRGRMAEGKSDPHARMEELNTLLADAEGQQYAVLRYYALGDMEALAKETGDFRRAYECASARLEISEKMNT